MEDTHSGNVPNACRLSYVSDGELLNGLVLGLAPAATGATNRPHVLWPFFFLHDCGSSFPQSSWKRGAERGEGSTSKQGPGNVLQPSHLADTLPSFLKRRAQVLSGARQREMVQPGAPAVYT